MEGHLLVQHMYLYTVPYESQTSHVMVYSLDIEHMKNYSSKTKSWLTPVNMQ